MELDEGVVKMEQSCRRGGGGRNPIMALLSSARQSKAPITCVYRWLVVARGLVEEGINTASKG